MFYQGKLSTRPLILAAILVVLFAFNSSSWAGNNHYPDGVEDFMSGAAPPPGLYLKQYGVYITKSSLRDKNGDDAGLDLDVSAFVTTSRFIYVTPLKLFCADYLVQALIPLYNIDFEISGVLDQDSSGLGDITVTPFGLSWHFSPNWHMVLAEDITLPTGNYDSDNLASQIVSRDNATFETVLAITYLNKGWDVSTKLMYDISTDGDENNIDYGDEFHFDWAVGYDVIKGLTIGVAGYAYWQLEEDSDNSGKAESFAIGPAIKYWPNKGRFSATLKYLDEFGVKNAAEGDRMFLNIIWAF